MYNAKIDLNEKSLVLFNSKKDWKLKMIYDNRFNIEFNEFS